MLSTVALGGVTTIWDGASRAGTASDDATWLELAGLELAGLELAGLELAGLELAGLARLPTRSPLSLRYRLAPPGSDRRARTRPEKVRPAAAQPGSACSGRLSWPGRGLPPAPAVRTEYGPTLLEQPEAPLWWQVASEGEPQVERTFVLAAALAVRQEAPRRLWLREA